MKASWYFCSLILFALPVLAATPKGLTEAQCIALKNARVNAAAIGLPTRGAQIVTVAMAGQPGNQHCKLEGQIKPVDLKAPDINFQLYLPLSWNGKALQLGGSGFDGAIKDADTARLAPAATPGALKQGYATFGSDAGHQGGVSDAAFTLNDEAWKNFAGEQIKKTHDVAVTLIRQAYGSKPSRMYFQGNSQGGHEALAAIQRYPQDYDGAIAIHPVYNVVELHMAGIRIGQAVYNTPGAWISPAKAALIANAVSGACDKLDGLSDGVVANTRACEATFKPERLRCEGKKDADNCLTAPQLALVQMLSQPVPLGVTLPTGDHFAPWPILQGADASAVVSVFGSGADKPRPAARNIIISFPYMMGDQAVRYEVMRSPDYDSLNFDPAAHAARLNELASQVDDNNADIRAFVQHGGKLLLMHGTADMAVPPGNTVAYYEKLKAQFGEKALHQFARFYLAPGFTHSSGTFRASWDSLGALDKWVDHGIDPGQQVMTDTNKATAGREMPLCEYPQFPEYKGQGDTKSASSFVCTNK
ncbi:tannase/feruloyl esterase family alpha/beta hydrolase [Rahnella victoriana]|uniref:tannase/feruloyl esterase family alpha/beta hydrolase n=1 Tax=Rahnella victoriana TaxID=1510570 RepID=UPI00103BCD6D|nr:tannase/feruloyl esterase family alpha/beta hydrolase [Rahnella victoriana]TBX30963.1 tannase/feruloyl esterase family alpha/beta hydrolase [Rahnella victoriana]